jgi:hypothetical protein
MRYCEAPDPAPYVAALGILSHEGSREQNFIRDVSRHSWLATKPPDVVARFVLRAGGGSATAHEERSRHADVTLIDAPAHENQGSGALISLFGWFSCALHAWPAARAIGKAEDDVWVNLTSAAAQLSAALAAGGLAREHLYWGSFEVYHWSPSARAARGWRYWPCSWIVNCSDRRYSFDEDDAAPLRDNDVARFQTGEERYWNALIGPFAFAKGPLFALSASLVRSIVDHRKVRAERDAAIESARRHFDAGRKAATTPYEDVFTGLAVTLAADAPVRYVSMPKNGMATMLTSRLEMAPSTVVAHLSRKDVAPMHMLTAQHYARAHHCAPAAHEVECFVNGTLCNGAPFTGCTTRAATFEQARCSLEAEDVARPDRLAAGMAVSCALDALRTTRTGAPHGRLKRSQAYVGRGTCSLTEFGPSNCIDGTKGAWEAARSLESCVALCHCCAQCHYVSFSADQNDCSWFRQCDEHALTSHGSPANTFVTVRVDKTLSR